MILGSVLPHRDVASASKLVAAGPSGICSNTFYRWKAKYSVMEIPDVRRLKTVEDENARLKKIVAEQAPGHPGAEVRCGLPLPSDSWAVSPPI